MEDRAGLNGHENTAKESSYMNTAARASESRGTSRPRNLVWHCDSCEHHDDVVSTEEAGERGLRIGDEETCAGCREGTARLKRPGDLLFDRDVKPTSALERAQLRAWVRGQLALLRSLRAVVGGDVVGLSIEEGERLLEESAS